MRVMLSIGQKDEDGNKPKVTVDLENQEVVLPSATLDFPRTLNLMNRLNRIFERNGVIPGRKDGAAHPLRSTNFIYENIQEINATKRGKLKKAPWWLRWKFDKVITKDELHDRT